MERKLTVIRAILEYLEEHTVDAGGARKPLVEDLPADAPIRPLAEGALGYHAGLCADEGLIVDRSAGFVSMTWKGHDWLEERRRMTSSGLQQTVAAAVASVKEGEGQPAQPPAAAPEKTDQPPADDAA